MRSEAMKSKMLYDRPLPVQRIVNAIADSKHIDILFIRRCILNIE